MQSAKALGLLIDTLERGDRLWDCDLMDAAVGLSLANDLVKAANGYRDGVARLEAQLRTRGWAGLVIADRSGGNSIGWVAEWTKPVSVKGEAPSEARARLLSVLGAMLHDATMERTTKTVSTRKVVGV